MSSLVRRLQIRMLKARGYQRTKHRVVIGIDGRPQLERVARGGMILNPKGETVGYCWPRRHVEEGLGG